MKIAIRAVLERYALVAVGKRAEKTRRRSITISPVGGGTVLLRERSRSRASDSAAGQPLAAVA
jgi:hypothetical protein